LVEGNQENVADQQAQWIGTCLAEPGLGLFGTAAVKEIQSRIRTATINKHSNGKSPFLMGKSTITGHFQ